MAEKENQHYVPKFYLREFSYENNRKQIGIFNLEKDFFYPTAKIKFQATKKNYYGKDSKVENHLAELEGLLAPAVQELIRTEIPPKQNTDFHFRLLTFAISSDLRTTVHENSLNEGTDKMIKTVYRSHPDFKDRQDDFSVKFNNSSIFGIAQMAELLPVALDLGYKLLINETKVPIVTSDNPVVKYNILLEEKKVHGGIVGLGTIGLCIFLPISSNHMLLFYDKDCYSVGVTGANSFKVRQESVINDLNLLHFLNCDTTVFFDDQVNESYLRGLHEKSKSFTRANQSIVTEHEVRDQFGNTSNDSIIHSRSTECRTNLRVPFIKTLPKARKYQPASMAHIRAYPRKLIDLGLLGPLTGPKHSVKL